MFTSAAERTQLYMATMRSRIEKMSLAQIDQPLPRNPNNITLLHQACNNGWVEIKELLLAKGANRSLRDRFGRTAEEYEHPEAIPGYELISAVKSKDIRNVENVLAQHPDLINSTDIEGNTPLHIAATLELPDIIALLLKKGADFTIRNHGMSMPDRMATDPKIQQMISGYQYRLLNKLNAYLSGQGKSTLDGHGYCNGLAALYLYAKSQGRQDELFQRIQYALQKDNRSKAPDPRIDTLVKEIKMLQDPDLYSENTAYSQLDRSIELLRKRGQPKLRQELSLAFSFSETELTHLFRDIVSANKMLLIGSPEHAIALYKTNEGYCLYDANTTGSTERFFSDAEQAAKWVKAVMEMDTYPGAFLPLCINVFDHIDRPPTAYPSPQEIIANLLQANNNLERQSAWPGVGPLYMAAYAGHEATVRMLLDRGVDPNGPTAHILDDERTVLHAAVFSGDAATVKTLLVRGANPNVSIGKATALSVAVVSRHKNIAEILLGHGADPLQKMEGKSALDWAISQGNREMAKTLFKAGQAQFKAAVYMTALRQALAYRNFSIGWEIIKAGFAALVAPLTKTASPSKPSSHLTTPLLAAHKAQQGNAAGTGLGPESPP